MHLLPGLWQRYALTFPNGQITHPEREKSHPPFVLQLSRPPVSSVSITYNPSVCLCRLCSSPGQFWGKDSSGQARMECIPTHLGFQREGQLQASVVALCRTPGQAQLSGFWGVLHCVRRRGPFWLLLLLAGDSTFHSLGRDGLQERETQQPCISKPLGSLSPCSGCSSPVLNSRFLRRCQADDVLWLILIFLHCKQYIYFHILQVIWSFGVVLFFVPPLPLLKLESRS